MSETKTYCVGRLLIDIPKEAEINGQGYEFMFGRLESERTSLDAKGFAARMDKREAVLKANNPNNDRSLKEVKNLGATSRILVTLENNFGHNNYGFEAYRLDNGQLFSLVQKNYREDVFRNEVLGRVEKDLLPHLRTRAPDEIPSEPGFCTQNGFIADDGSKDQAEYGQIGFRFKAWPDVLIVFTTRENSDKLEDPLLTRYAKSPIHSTFAGVMNRVKTFRQGDRSVGQFSGQELLLGVPTEYGFYTHQLVWDSIGKPNAAFAPKVGVEMFTGKGQQGEQYVRPALSDDQAIKLFDNIVNSIRLRPTGPAKVSSADPSPQLPLGDFVATGAACPQTGYWRCPENDMDGQTRLFRQGEIMPQAVIAGKSSLFGRKSDPHRTNTVWQLVNYEAITKPATNAPVASTAETAASKVEPDPSDLAKDA